MDWPKIRSMAGKEGLSKESGLEDVGVCVCAWELVSRCTGGSNIDRVWACPRK